MKFTLFAVALLPAITAAATIGERDVETMDVEFPTLDAAHMDNYVDTSAEGHDLESSLMGTEAVCRPAFPRYCPRFDFCCRKKAVGCCAKACCLPGTTHCRNGHCYGPA